MNNFQQFEDGLICFTDHHYLMQINNYGTYVKIRMINNIILETLFINENKN